MTTKAEVKACEGNCIETHGEHSGQVREVSVIGNGHRNPFTFNYCENAIKEDESRGFAVLITEIKE